MPKDFFSIPEAARRCAVARSTMHRWVTSGKIKHYSTPGGHKRILKQDLHAFMAESGMPVDPGVFKAAKQRILIVDDEESIQVYLKTILGGIFTHIDVASDGFEAGVKLMSFKPHLMILDLVMPGMDGFQVIEKIRADPAVSKTRIMVLTGHGTEENRERAQALGVDAFLPKPCDKKTLIRQVERILS